MPLEELIAQVGAPVVMAGSALEGDVTPFLGGVVSHLGALRFLVVVIAATGGTLVGDLCWYWLGRQRGARIRASRLYRKAGGAVEAYVDRLGSAQLLTARFVYGTRIASMIFWGMKGLPLGRFLAIDLVGCVAWTGLLAGLGFVASDRATAVLGEVKTMERWLLGALALAVVVGLVRAALARRRA